MTGTQLEVMDHKNPNKQTYAKTLNPRDADDLALLLWDLKRIFGAPVEKAIQKFQQERESPFW
jgi:hypothetical protein